MANQIKTRSFSNYIDNNSNDQTCKKCNEWLEENQDIEIVGFDTCMADGAGYMFVVTIMYTEKIP